MHTPRHLPSSSSHTWCSRGHTMTCVIIMVPNTELKLRAHFLEASEGKARKGRDRSRVPSPGPDGNWFITLTLGEPSSRETWKLPRPGHRWGSGKAALPPTPPSHWKIPESGSWPDLGDTSHSPPGLPEGCLLPDQIQSCFGQPHLLNPTGTQSRRAGTSGPLSEITEPEAISSPAGLRPAAVKQ